MALVLGIGAIVFFMGKRNTPRPPTDDGKEQATLLQDKAQLHSDSLMRHEMDGTAPSTELLELPAIERPGELNRTV